MLSEDLLLIHSRKNTKSILACGALVRSALVVRLAGCTLLLDDAFRDGVTEYFGFSVEI